MESDLKKICHRDIVIPVVGIGDGWIVVDKPAGMSLYNEPGEDLLSVLKSRVNHDGQYEKIRLYDSDFGLHPVHRLDRKTSGIILLTGQKSVMRHFTGQFESGKVEKKYFALVHGTIDKDTVHKKWSRWKYSITKNAGGRNNPAGTGRRIKAETLYRVVDTSRHYTLLELKLLTGRKHQIRKHAKLSGCPVVGDERYGSKRSVKFLLNNHSFNRLGLHAYSLTLIPPAKTVRVTFESLKIPDKIQNLFDEDKQG